MEMSRFALTFCCPMYSRSRRGRNDSSTVASSSSGIAERIRSSAMTGVYPQMRQMNAETNCGECPLDAKPHEAQSDEHEETSSKNEWPEASRARCSARPPAKARSRQSAQ